MLRMEAMASQTRLKRVECEQQAFQHTACLLLALGLPSLQSHGVNLSCESITYCKVYHSARGTKAGSHWIPADASLFAHKAILLRGKDKSRSLRFWKKTQTWSEGELAKSHPPLWHTQWRKERLFTLKHSRQRLLKLPILGSGKPQKSANFLTKATIASTWECYSRLEEEERVRGHSRNFAGLSLLSCHVLVTVTYSDLALTFIYYYIYCIILLYLYII